MTMFPNDSAIVIQHHQIVLKSKLSESLYCDVRFPDTAKSALPVIIFAHGFKGFKDWGSFPTVCTMLAEQGFYVISFNFSHNGIDGHSQEFTQLDRFERNTFSREVDELLDVVHAVGSDGIPSHVLADKNRIALLGHSRGGGIALLAASREPSVRAVVAWASVAGFNRYSDAQKERWRANGVFETKNMRTGQIMRLGLDLLNDIEQHADELDVLSAVRNLHRPLLIVHGDQDISVKLADAEALREAGDPELTTLAVIPNTGHTFGATHPFVSVTPALQRVLDTTVAFLRDHLG